MNNSSKVCQTCLSSDRRLVPLPDIQKILQELYFSELAGISGGVCYVCNRILLRFSTFKSQVSYAQKLLNFEANTTYLSLSSLGCQINDAYDFEYTEADPLIYLPITHIKDEDGVKSPVDDGNDPNPGLRDNSEDATVSVNACVEESETIGIVERVGQRRHSSVDHKISRKKVTKKRGPSAKKTVTTKKSVSGRSRSSPLQSNGTTTETEIDKTLEEKYETVEFTEEEMLKNREEKRNQPNFKKIPYKCNLCVLGFTKKDTLDKHSRKHKKIGKHGCPVCELYFPTPKALERHRRKHYTRFRCKLCRHCAAEEAAIRNHCRLKHRGDTSGRIHCQACTAVCKSPEELSAHTQAEHPLQCADCGERFKGKNTLRAHMRRIHLAKREFSCEVCGKTFTCASRLEAHAARHGGAAARRLAYCAPCRRQYKNIYVYRNHRHNSPAHAHHAHECATCHKKFASKVYWKRHVDFFHLNNSKFKCLDCNKIFMSAWSLRNHRQLHHGEHRDRNHHCDLCDKNFFTSSTLASHKLTHSAERSYMCAECGDTFKQRPSLYTHCRLVHRGHKRGKT